MHLGKGKSKVPLLLCKAVCAFMSLGKTSSPKAQGHRATTLPTYQGSHSTAACHRAGPAVPHQWSRLQPHSPTQPSDFHIPLLLPQVSLREGTSHQEQTCLAPREGESAPSLCLRICSYSEGIKASFVTSCLPEGQLLWLASLFLPAHADGFSSLQRAACSCVSLAKVCSLAAGTAAKEQVGPQE